MGLLDATAWAGSGRVWPATREGIVGRVARLATTRATIDEAVIEEVEEILISSDVGLDASGAIIQSIRSRVKEERYSSTAELLRLLKDEIARATQLEPIHARAVFPSFDEPAFRATFDVVITAPARFEAVSNMPVLRQSPVGDGRRETVFDREGLWSIADHTPDGRFLLAREKGALYADYY